MAQKVVNEFDALIKAGFARQRAEEYLKILAEERNAPVGEGVQSRCRRRI